MRIFQKILNRRPADDVEDCTQLPDTYDHPHNVFSYKSINVTEKQKTIRRAISSFALITIWAMYYFG
jgi:hypothetical protein